MNDNEFAKAIDLCEKLDFFGGQRAGRELWFEKPVDVQDRDIKQFAEDVAFLKYFINRQRAEIERMNKHNTEMARKHYSDGIKEFAEKLKEQFSTENHTDWVSNLYFPKWMAQIDNLVKKMTEDQK